MRTAHSSPAITDEVARAEAEVERARERVAVSVSALRDEITRQADWRRWLSRHPLICLGGALAVGFCLGGRRRPLFGIGGRR
ncbi:MAG TPA: hypothetical protein VHO06_02610 [Polyangia bacterium]|nr:hypothetical protein [Polyangia bacterium]